MELLPYAFALSKELQQTGVEADKVPALACSSQGKLLTFSRKEKSQWGNDEMGILPFLEDGIWP